ncbi:putative ribonuclease H-like domain-containing protein [Tanacetum coccineum]
MCDKKNSVLFTDTECVVLSPDIKLFDENHVLIKVPRKDNMYSVDLKNVVPQGGLTCLFAKATPDESNIWHRRLRHVNFKTMNKLVKGNLVRGYSTNSKAFMIFNIDALTKSMNYKPVVAWNQSNSNAGTKACDDASKARVETVPGKDYILLPLWTQDPPFFSSSKDSPNAGFKPLGEEEMKDAEDPGNEDSEVSSTEEPRVNQKKDVNVNNTNTINIVSSTVNAAGIEDNVVDENIVYGCADDPNMPKLEDTVYSNDEDVGAEAVINNLDAFMPVYKNKKDKRGIVIKNKARLVPQGYTQEEGIYYDEVFAPVTRIEAIRLFLAYASFKDFVVYQMDVNSAFLYGKIEEEVYVYQPLGFEDPDFPDRVYKVEKALYGLQQAPKVWYETLSTYLLDMGFREER